MKKKQQQQKDSLSLAEYNALEHISRYERRMKTVLQRLEKIARPSLNHVTQIFTLRQYCELQDEAAEIKWCKAMKSGSYRVHLHWHPFEIADDFLDPDSKELWLDKQVADNVGRTKDFEDYYPPTPEGS